MRKNVFSEVQGGDPEMIQSIPHKLYLIFRSYDVIINCTGLGAQKLCNDSKLSVIRGQVIRVKAPWIKFAAYADHHSYIIPGNCN